MADGPRSGPLYNGSILVAQPYRATSLLAASGRFFFAY